MRPSSPNIQKEADGPLARRRDAARHMLHPHRLQDSIALSTQPSLRNSTLAGLQAALTAGIALPLVYYLTPWSHLIGFASLGALVALFGRLSPSGRRIRVLLQCALLQVLAVLGMSAASWLGAPMWVQLLLLALSCGVFFFASVTAKFGAPGPLIFVFAAGASIAVGLDFGQVIERGLATAVVAALAVAICLASEMFRHRPSAERQLPSEPNYPLNHRITAATRIFLGAAIAIFVSYAVGASYPAWAAMGALAVLQGTHLSVTLSRALQRMAGTMVGALFAWALLSQHPSVWVVILAIVGLQLLTEIVIGVNYAFGQMLVTPMALLMTYLGAAQTVGPEMAPERVLDTILGAAVGIVIAVALSSTDDRRRFVEHCRSRLAS